MTTYTETTIVEENPSRWQKFVASLNAFVEVMDYDPIANTDSKVKFVWQELERLEIRVRELERRSE